VHNKYEDRVDIFCEIHWKSPQQAALSNQLHSLPLFPLETVLFPGGMLPLRIFEVRYLDMIRKCHAAGAPFGVVRLKKGREVSAAGIEEAFEPVGTLAAIRKLSTVQSGLRSVVCQGQQRFRVLRSERAKLGLWIAVVERIEDDQAIPVPPEHEPIARGLATLLAQLKARGVKDLPEPEAFDDCAWLANRWAELLPLQHELKQQLMQLESPLVRLELVGDALERLGVLKA
jgi:uncharacterized protein